MTGSSESAGAKASKISIITNKDDLNNAIAKSTQGGSLVVIDCFAKWCGPCIMIAPQVEKLAEQFAHVHFYKLDVNDAEDCAEELHINAMPTFLFYKDGKCLEPLVGANIKALTTTIEQNAGEPST